MSRPFGSNVRALRERAKLTQEQLAERLGLKRPTPISLMEGPRKRRVPKPATITRLAVALEAQPWELLDGVVTEYDRLRAGARQKSGAAAETLGQNTAELEQDIAPALVPLAQDLGGTPYVVGSAFDSSRQPTAISLDDLHSLTDIGTVLVSHGSQLQMLGEAILRGQISAARGVELGRTPHGRAPRRTPLPRRSRKAAS